MEVTLDVHAVAAVIALCRKQRFQTHVLQWMSDPKLTKEVGELCIVS